MLQRLSEPRIAPLPISEWDPELRERFERPGGLGQILNVMTTMANYTGLFKRWLMFANHLLFKNSLSARDREILILRTVWLAGCEYEWGQHLKIVAETVPSVRPSLTPLPKVPRHRCGARPRRR